MNVGLQGVREGKVQGMERGRGVKRREEVEIKEREKRSGEEGRDGGIRYR